MEELHKNKAQELQTELAMRGQYYFKGFATLLQNILANLANFVEIEATTIRANEIRNRLHRINRLYASIPFEKITKHPDYDILIQIKAAVLTLSPKVEAVLNGGAILTKLRKTYNL